MRLIVKYLAISRAAVRNNLAYGGEVVGRVFFLSVMLYIFLRLWQSTYEHNPAGRFDGLSINDILWYLTFTESIFMSAPRLSHRIDEDVRTGALCVQLIRPVSYPLYWLFTNLGERAVRWFMTLVAGSVLALLLVGPPSNPLAQLSFAVLALPLAFVLDFLGNFLVGLCAFWLEDTSGLFLINARLTMILGGMLLPLNLLPAWIGEPLTRLPWASILFAPANLFLHPSWQTLSLTLIQQAAWVTVYAIIVSLVYRKAIARVSANGG